MTGIDHLGIAHIIVLGLWGGIVLGELVLELSPKTEPDHRLVARVHYLTDLFIELPLLAGVIVTGLLLERRVDHHSTMHWVKLALALTAIGTNVWAAITVVRRHRATDPAEVVRLTKLVRLSGLGVPFGLGALYIGLRYFA